MYFLYKDKEMIKSSPFRSDLVRLFLSHSKEERMSMYLVKQEMVVEKDDAKLKGELIGLAV